MAGDRNRASPVSSVLCERPVSELINKYSRRWGFLSLSRTAPSADSPADSPGRFASADCRSCPSAVRPGLTTVLRVLSPSLAPAMRSYGDRLSAHRSPSDTGGLLRSMSDTHRWDGPRRVSPSRRVPPPSAAPIAALPQGTVTGLSLAFLSIPAAVTAIPVLVSGFSHESASMADYAGLRTTRSAAESSIGVGI